MPLRDAANDAMLAERQAERWAGAYHYTHVTFSYCMIYEVIWMLNTKYMVLFGVTPCCLVGRYECFRINHSRPNFSRQVLRLRVLQSAGSLDTKVKTTLLYLTA
jgi:hypothetical protein